MGWGNKVPEVDPNLNSWAGVTRSQQRILQFYLHSMTISVLSLVALKLPTPLSFGPKMPFAHAKVILFQCYEDVGGTDIRVSAKFNEDAQWWVGWHTSKGLDSWFRTKPSKWRLIGWELWGHVTPAHEFRLGSTSGTLLPQPMSLICCFW